MTQITVRVSDELVAKIDRAARALRRSRADLVRQGIECSLDDLEDLRLGLDVLGDSADPFLGWDEIRASLASEAG